MNTLLGVFILYACLLYAGEVKQKRKGFVHHERDLVTEVISLYYVQCNVAEFFISIFAHNGSSPVKSKKLECFRFWEEQDVSHLF